MWLKYFSSLVNCREKFSPLKEKKKKKKWCACVINNFITERPEKTEPPHLPVKLLSIRTNFQLKLHLNWRHYTSLKNSVYISRANSRKLEHKRALQQPSSLDFKGSITKWNITGSFGNQTADDCAHRTLGNKALTLRKWKHFCWNPMLFISLATFL